MRRDSSRLRWSGPRPGPIASTVTEHHRSLGDRKSTRLNSSHSQISYAVFCLKKKKNKTYSTINAAISLVSVSIEEFEYHSIYIYVYGDTAAGGSLMRSVDETHHLQ